MPIMSRALFLVLFLRYFRGEVMDQYLEMVRERVKMRIRIIRVDLFCPPQRQPHHLGNSSKITKFSKIILY